jgi:hypothetical protein
VRWGGSPVTATPLYYLPWVGRDRVVNISTRYAMDALGVKSRVGVELPHLSRLALRRTQPPVQWVPGHFPEGKVKVKSALSGFFSTMAYAAFCTLAPETLPSFTTRGAVYQSDTQRTLLAKEGTRI